MVLITPAPKFKGAFPVGTTSLETKPETTTGYGVFASLFYPADLASATNPTYSKWDLAPPNFLATEIVRFIGISLRIVTWALSWFIARFNLFAFQNAPLVSKAQFPAKIPVVIFSHGLAGNQTMYAQLVSTLAARGFLVLAVEHREGSACASARNAYTDSIPFTEPPPEGPEAVQFRVTQLQQRVREVNESFRLLESLNKGESIDNLLGNTAELDWTGRLDLENCVLMGHSFGGATVLCALQEEGHPFSCGIALDPWMYAVRNSQPITTPLLSIQSEHFHWTSNLSSLRTLWNAPTASPLNQFAVIPNTQHNAISDFSMLFPQSMRWIVQGGYVSSDALLQTYDGLEMRFLNGVLPKDVGVLDRVEVGEMELPVASPVKKSVPTHILKTRSVKKVVVTTKPTASPTPPPTKYSMDGAQQQQQKKLASWFWYPFKKIGQAIGLVLFFILSIL
ncbi:Platelet-activating factor acetylhydrolase [Podochytrium sp. JEL0797]|nr:Platelet-activating factor acetylhydrolase [Podochytrium sp. JEL0797]